MQHVIVIAELVVAVGLIAAISWAIRARWRRAKRLHRWVSRLARASCQSPASCSGIGLDSARYCALLRPVS